MTAQPAASPPALLDGRGWEQVSPPDKGVANITLFPKGSGPLLASPSGDAITYLSGGGSELEPQGEPLSSQNVSRHGQGGWSTRDIAPPNAQRYNVKSGESEYQIFSDNLESSIAESSPYTPLSQWTVGRERTPYVRDESDCPTGVVSVERLQQTECFTPLLIDTGPYKDVEEGVEYGGSRSDQRGLVSAVAATPDLSHVVLKAGDTELINGAGGNGLYEWDAGRLSLLSQTKAGTGCAGTLGVPGNFSNLGYNSQNALSPDGALAVWAGAGEAGAAAGECAGHLYLRDVPRAMTVQLDEVHGVAGAGQPDAVYEDASVGDEHVFFTDSQQLTNESSGTDLYEYDFDRASDAGQLVDMTVPVNAGEAAGVVNVVGASEDGSVVYAVATGVLTPETEENGNGEHAVSGRPNLYALGRVDGAWKATYLATLSETDREDWGRLARKAF